LNKIIKLSFSRAADIYEKEAVIQKHSAKILSEIAKDVKGKGIDLGCGTGFLYEYIKKDIIGIDISFNMANHYKRKNKKVVVADIENLPFKNNIFDFALSNFSLHWTDLKKSTAEIKRVLKENGYFIFNIPIKGSLKIVETILGEENFDFLDKNELLDILKENDFIIKQSFEKEFFISFKDGISLLEHLHKTGSAVGKKGKTVGEKKKIVDKFKNYTKPAFLNYKLIFISAIYKKI